MISYKSQEEIELISQGAVILSKLHGMLSDYVAPGVTTKYLDDLATEFILDHKAQPSFKFVGGYEFTLCTSLNEEVVHGLPDTKPLEEEDIISIDSGVYYKGFHTDSAYSYYLGDKDQDKINLLKVTRRALDIAIELAVKGNRTGDIGFAVQTYVESNGYTVIRELVGHGVGRKLHEDPTFPNYGRRGNGAKLRNGMVFALEPMVAAGSKEIYYGNDGWAVKMSDHKPAAHFEHTVSIYNNKTNILTNYEYINKKFSYSS